MEIPTEEPHTPHTTSTLPPTAARSDELWKVKSALRLGVWVTVGSGGQGHEVGVRGSGSGGQGQGVRVRGSGSGSECHDRQIYKVVIISYEPRLERTEPERDDG